MRIPLLDPQQRLVYTTCQAINALQIAVGTWYKYAKLVGVEPVKRMGSWSKWYTHDQVMQVWECIVQTRMSRGQFK